MLKKPAGSDSPAALLNGLFERPEVGLTARALPTRRMMEGRRGEVSNQATTPSEATPLHRFALNHLQKNRGR